MGSREQTPLPKDPLQLLAGLALGPQWHLFSQHCVVSICSAPGPGAAEMRQNLFFSRSRSLFLRSQRGRASGRAPPPPPARWGSLNSAPLALLLISLSVAVPWKNPSSFYGTYRKWRQELESLANLSCLPQPTAWPQNTALSPPLVCPLGMGQHHGLP